MTKKFYCQQKEIVKNWEPTLVLRILITAGEYSRLYRYEECEIEAWTLAYRLASEINDYHAIIYGILIYLFIAVIKTILCVPNKLI